MSTRSIALLTAGCLVAAGLVVTASASSWGSSTSDTGISWTDCADGAQCADLAVPADWRRPGAAHATVRLAKLPAQDPAHRAGTLLVNLGADGATAEHLPGARDGLAELTQWFDVVAFDARGRGGSSGVTCDPAPTFAAVMFDLDRRTWQEFAHANGEWAETCRAAAGPLAHTMDSWQVANDMEAIRTALGEERLNYYGNSYGTVFGKAYAELFPTKVHRMYLDSAANHTDRSPLRVIAPMAELTADKFRQFGEWCAADPECALYPENARDVWDELLARAHQAPLPAPGAGPEQTVGPAQLHFTAFSSVPQESRWATYAESLAEARAGDATDLHLTPADVPSDLAAENLAWCADFPFQHGWGAMTAIERQLREIDPRAGWLMAKMYYGRCIGIRHQGSFPPHRIQPTGLPPVLLVGGLRDNTTPPVAGQQLAAQLPGSRWLTADAGHAVYLGGNRCVRDHVHRYLLEGALPPPDQTCPA